MVPYPCPAAVARWSRSCIHTYIHIQLYDMITYIYICTYIYIYIYTHALIYFTNAITITILMSPGSVAPHRNERTPWNVCPPLEIRVGRTIRKRDGCRATEGNRFVLIAVVSHAFAATCTRAFASYDMLTCGSASFFLPASPPSCLPPLCFPSCYTSYFSHASFSVCFTFLLQSTLSYYVFQLSAFRMLTYPTIWSAISHSSRPQVGFI